MNKKLLNYNIKIISLSSLGVCLENYDFIVYSVFALSINQLFFPELISKNTIISTFLIYVIPYLTRPLGGMIFGLMADIRGRKKQFINIMLLMAIATFLIAVLPTYNQAGILASAALILLRILQSVSFGAEIPCAIIYLKEQESLKPYNSFAISIIMVGASIGSLSASLILFFMSSFMKYENLLNYGWRIAFLLGSFLMLVSYKIRNNLYETSDFISLSKEYSNTYLKIINTILSHEKINLLIGCLIILPAASLIIFNLYFPFYIQKIITIQIPSIYIAIILGLIFAIIILPISGYLGDKLGNMKLIVFFLIIAILGFKPLYDMLYYDANPESKIILFIIFYQFIIAGLIPNVYNYVGSLFPTQIRLTATSFAYNIAYLIGSLLPLAESAGIISIDVIPYVFSIIFIVALICFWFKYRYSRINQ